MNVDSEQITLDKNILIAQDQPLSPREMMSCLIEDLGEENCKIINFGKSKLVLEYKEGSKRYHLLVRSCTYLGNPHPIFKKRVQFPLWFNEYCRKMQDTDVEVRYLGVYHYSQENYGKNIIYIDFDKETYLKKKGHNSSAHVYINDLYQSLIYGIFSKEDKKGNNITAIRRDKLSFYLKKTKEYYGNELFDLFRQFNNGFTFGQWLNALDAIKEMYTNGWQQWRQAEWAGWFLEYRFNKFTIDNNVTNKMRYVGSSNKGDGNLDFDIRFEQDDFYGDLKASDVSKNETPGNDQRNFVECIYRYDKFWYVIYEHETVKDSSEPGYHATIDRNRFIKSVDPKYNKDEMSYSSRMKKRVRFVKMTILELNRVNFRKALTDFLQGKQPSGEARNPKFNINKSTLKDDNFVVFRYSYNEERL